MLYHGGLLILMNSNYLKKYAQDIMFFIRVKKWLNNCINVRIKIGRMKKKILINKKNQLKTQCNIALLSKILDLLIVENKKI